MLASTDGAPVAAFEDRARRLAGVQCHPEVMHSEHGQQVLRALPARRRRASTPDWTPANVIDEQVDAIRAQVGDERVICGLSGGVDSAVAAALVHRAVGDQLTCVFVDHGLLRKGEREQVEQRLRRRHRRPAQVVDAAERFLARARRRHRPGEEAQDHRPRVHPRRSRTPRARSSPRPARTGSRSSSSCRARSTRTSSSPAAAPARRTSRATTTSAGCPTTCSSSSSSRCARCSRTRCARSARELGLPPSDRVAPAVPRPGPGIRIIGEVTARPARHPARRPTRSPARS